VTPPERAALAELRKLGLHDDVREPLAGSAGVHLLDYRAGVFHQDLGMRIDLVLASEPVADCVCAAWLDRHARKGKARAAMHRSSSTATRRPMATSQPVVPPPSAPAAKRGAKKLPQPP